MERTNNVYIISACRSPIGSFKGQFSNMSVYELARPVLQAAVDRSGISATDINEIYIGNVLSAGKGQNPARQASMLAEFPNEVPSTTINMLCGSGLKAVVNGFLAIRSGDTKIALCGGMESMSQAEHTVFLRSGVKLGNCTLKDSMISDGLTDAAHNVHMGVTAEEVATKYDVSREAQDEFAYNSQMKCAKAMQERAFVEEIVGIPDANDILILQDEYPKPNTTLAGLAKLKPAFIKPHGTITPGNASGINDGAAFVVLADPFEVQSRKLIPLARIIGYAEAGIEPMLMGIAPINAIQRLLEKIHWNLEDVDLFEINEAFASQSIVILRELGLDQSKVNVSGGAIALGHPIGASGARLLVTLIYNLRRLNKKRGICALCIGGGMGIAMAIENSKLQ